MAPARMHVNSDSSLLDDFLRLHGTSLDGTQRQDFAALEMTVKPNVATAAPHTIPVITLRRSISFMGLLLVWD